MKTALLFVLMMLILIAPHEFGHMIVAKLCGVQVNEFSIGFGPAIFKRKKGETLYSIRAIPLGGFCRMEDETEPVEDENATPKEIGSNPRAYNNKTNLQKLAILLAGVTMNIIIAIFITIIAISIDGVPTNSLASIEKNSPAAKAGIVAGDTIVDINGSKTDNWSEVVGAINEWEPGKKLAITVERDGSEKTYSVEPQLDKETDRYIIGIKSQLSRSPLLCVPYGLKYTWALNAMVIDSFKMIFSGQAKMDDVSGPVGLVQVVDQTREYGITSYLILLAIVSINLALINLLPIPGLDGGKILFIILKKLSFGRITDDMEMKATVVGALVLIGLFVMLTINDIGKLL